MNLRGDNPDDIVLPTHMTKHSVYAHWCYSQGWKLTKKSSAKTIYNPVALYLPRPFDDVENGLWSPGSVAKGVVTWPTFLMYWKSMFPNLKGGQRKNPTNCNLDGDTLTADAEEVDFEREVHAMEETVKKAKVPVAAYQ
eukprot:15353168-Ditylum_brightwellii.AAC.1